MADSTGIVPHAVLVGDLQHHAMAGCAMLACHGASMIMREGVLHWWLWTTLVQVDCRHRHSCLTVQDVLAEVNACTDLW